MHYDKVPEYYIIPNKAVNMLREGMVLSDSAIGQSRRAGSKLMSKLFQTKWKAW